MPVPCRAAPRRRPCARGRWWRITARSYGRTVRGRRATAEIVRDHHQIAVWVLHENLALSGLVIADPSPDLARSRMQRPRRTIDGRQHQFNAFDMDLEHDTAAIRRIERRGFPIAAALAQHDLRTFRAFQ